MVINSDFWQGKKVLITGHTGFKGAWLSLWLQQLGADVVGLSLDPTTQPNLFDSANVTEGMESIIGNINDLDLVKSVLTQHQPDIVFHLAAQALVRYSYRDPVETYQTNVMGTLNILEAIRICPSVKAAIMVTTDKCYDNKERTEPYREEDALGGYDPYSSSKACAEVLISSYRNSFFADEPSASIASVRAGNVIGGGDWSIDRLIPDIIKAKNNQTSLQIRSPNAIRPWQHVLEPLHGYLLLAEKCSTTGHDYAQAWNFGPLEEGLKSVEWIVNYFSDRWSDFSWLHDVQKHPHEAGILKLDCSKAHDLLSWHPQWSMNESLEKIKDWVYSFDNNEDMKKICLQQIASFSAKIATE